MKVALKINHYKHIGMMILFCSFSSVSPALDFDGFINALKGWLGGNGGAAAGGAPAPDKKKKGTYERALKFTGNALIKNLPFTMMASPYIASMISSRFNVISSDVPFQKFFNGILYHGVRHVLPSIIFHYGIKHVFDKKDRFNVRVLGAITSLYLFQNKKLMQQE